MLSDIIHWASDYRFKSLHSHCLHVLLFIICLPKILTLDTSIAPFRLTGRISTLCYWSHTWLWLIFVCWREGILILKCNIPINLQNCSVIQEEGSTKVFKVTPQFYFGHSLNVYGIIIFFKKTHTLPSILL